MLKFQYIWGCSSVGRVSGSHSEGRGFDSHQFHQKTSVIKDGARFLYTNFTRIALLKLMCYNKSKN